MKKPEQVGGTGLIHDLCVSRPVIPFVQVPPLDYNAY
jgi:hypothetical protein